MRAHPPEPSSIDDPPPLIHWEPKGSSNPLMMDAEGRVFLGTGQVLTDEVSGAGVRGTGNQEQWVCSQSPRTALLAVF